MKVHIDSSWLEVLEDEFQKPYWESLVADIKNKYHTSVCFPEGKNIFRAFDTTPFDQVKIVILGQDPYHTPGAAMGLSFSVPNGSKAQPSLRNIFKELQSDLSISRLNTDLSDWAEQGILLLNSVLTVEQGQPASHRGRGWEIFTDEVIRIISQKKEGIVFVLWGNYAIAKKSLIDTTKHIILTAPHPSPFSAHTGFFGSKPFSKINEYLADRGEKIIDW